MRAVDSSNECVGCLEGAGAINTGLQHFLAEDQDHPEPRASPQASMEFFVNASGSVLKALLPLLVHALKVSLLIILVGRDIILSSFPLSFFPVLFFPSSVFPLVSNGSESQTQLTCCLNCAALLRKGQRKECKGKETRSRFLCRICIVKYVTLLLL